MTCAEATPTNDAPTARSETEVPGGVVIAVRAISGVRFRARNLMGVVLRDDLGVIEWASFADAAAALRRFAAGDAPPPRKVERCPHCRGKHAAEDCRVHADAERRRAELRAALAAKATTTKDLPARGRGEEDHGCNEDAITHNGSGVRRVDAPVSEGSERVQRDAGVHRAAREGEIQGQAGDRVRPRLRDDPPATDARGGSPEGTATVTDTHTLDDYHRALSVVTTKGPVSVHVVSCKAHGIGRGLDMHDATELALEELVAQGRADRDIAGRYRARRPAAKPATPPDPTDTYASAPEPPLPASPAEERPAAYQCWHDSPHGDERDEPCEFDDDPASSHCAGCVCLVPDGATPPAPDAPDPVAYTEPEVHPEPDVPDPPAPSEILDPEVLQPEDPAECAVEELSEEAIQSAERSAANAFAAECSAAFRKELGHMAPLLGFPPEPADDSADVSTVGTHVAELGGPGPEIVQATLPVPADALRSIEDVAARHTPRPALDSVEAVLEEASALRRRTEVALAVASRDVEDANAREAAARAEHEAAFREAKAKSERLRQVQQLASQLGVEAGAGP